jgi:hypothetical protein
MNVETHTPSPTRRLLGWVLLLATLMVVIGFAGGPAFREKAWVAIIVFGALSGLVQLPLGFYRYVYVPLVQGVRCPRCSETALLRVAVESFGHRFYRCEWCGQRCKRSSIDSPWLDASGKADADLYKATPYFSPERKRKSRRTALLALGGMAVIGLSLAVGALLLSWFAQFFVPLVFLATWILFSILLEPQAGDKTIIPAATGVWDRDVDA